jgi:hypothetical protein
MHNIINLVARLFAFTAMRYFVLAGIPFLFFYRLARNRFARNKIQDRQALPKDLNTLFHPEHARLQHHRLLHLFHTLFKIHTDIQKDLGSFNRLAGL